MKRQKHPQGTHNFIVFKDNPQNELLGVAHELTRTDMLVISLESIGIDREVRVQVATPEGFYPITCQISWSTIYTDDSCQQILYALGMKFLKVPSDFLNFISYLKYRDT